MSSSSDEDLPRISFSPVRATGGEEEDIMVVDGSPVSSSRGIPKMLAGPIRNESVTSRLEEQPLARRKASEGKRKAGELSRERARLAREQQKEAKKHQKELDRAVRAAARAGSKEHSPAQRLKNMVVLLDQTLAENSNFMAEFAPALHALDGKLRISQLDEPGVVKWLRIESECGVDENARITKRSMEVEEKEMLVTMEAQGFVGLVHYSKQEAAGGSLPDGAVTLERYVDQLYASYPGAQISIAIEGIEAFFRGHRTRVNRQFRDAVRNAGDGNQGNDQASTSKGRKKVPSEKMFGDVSRVDCEEAVVQLQLRHGCVTRMCEDGQELAGYVISLTRAIADSPYQKENPFSFYAEIGQGPSKRELAEAGEENKLPLIWKHQLMQFNNLSVNMAAAIVAVYPSPAHLLQAYERCSSVEEAERLLKDIVIRRGVGVVSTSRKLGPVLSKRIHTMMTSNDPGLLLS